MNIKKLRKILNETPGLYISKVFIEFKLSNENKEKKELTKFYDFFNFDYKCMELNVLDWAKHDDILIVKVSKSMYMKKLEEFYSEKIIVTDLADI